MLYEIRIHHAAPDRREAMLNRFQNQIMPLYQKHGVKVIGAWTYTVGDPTDQLSVIYQWDDMPNRNDGWGKVENDPEWAAIRAETERDGPIVSRIEAHMLKPTDFSPLQ